MSVKTGKKLTNNEERVRPLKQEWSQRPTDGKFVLWHLLPYVKGYSVTKHQPVWVIRGVFKRMPKWAV